MDNNKLKELAEQAWEACHGCDDNDKEFWINGFISGYNNKEKIDVDEIKKYCNKHGYYIGEYWFPNKPLETPINSASGKIVSINVIPNEEILISYSEYLHKRDLLNVVKENIPVRVRLFMNRNKK